MPLFRLFFWLRNWLKQNYVTYWGIRVRSDKYSHPCPLTNPTSLLNFIRGISWTGSFLKNNANGHVTIMEWGLFLILFHSKNEVFNTIGIFCEIGCNRRTDQTYCYQSDLNSFKVTTCIFFRWDLSDGSVCSHSLFGF